MSFTKCRFPFDWKNPLGYFVAVAIIYITNVNMFLMAAGILTSLFGGLINIYAAINDTKNNLNEINENAKLEENHLQATEQLSDFVRTHSLLIQLSECFLVIAHN